MFDCRIDTTYRYQKVTRFPNCIKLSWHYNKTPNEPWHSVAVSGALDIAQTLRSASQYISEENVYDRPSFRQAHIINM